MNDAIPIAFAWNVGSFLLGLLLGHWFAIYRDRRKEFNEIADRLDGIFERLERSPSPMNEFPTKDVALLKRQLNWWQRFIFESRIKAYNQVTSMNNCDLDAEGCASFVKKDAVRKALRNLRKSVRRR